jgi:hypothetical protein
MLQALFKSAAPMDSAAWGGPEDGEGCIETVRAALISLGNFYFCI